jgi:hypothetical protein
MNDNDPLRAARGILLGVVIGSGFWAAALWLWLRW